MYKQCGRDRNHRQAGRADRYAGRYMDETERQAGRQAAKPTNDTQIQRGRQQQAGRHTDETGTDRQTDETER